MEFGFAWMFAASDAIEILGKGPILAAHVVRGRETDPDHGEGSSSGCSQLADGRFCLLDVAKSPPPVRTGPSPVSNSDF